MRAAVIYVVFSIGFVLPPAIASAGMPKLIAVLPLDVANTDGKMSKAAEASFEEMLRDTATDALTGQGWTVLATQNMIQTLRDNGLDPEHCGEGDCPLAAARNLKAAKFISGAVQWVDGEFTASIRLIDTETGRILASERVEGQTTTALRKEFESKAAEFFRKGGMMSGDNAPPVAAAPDVQPSGPHKTASAVTASVGTLIVSAKPTGKVRIDLADPHGAKSNSGSPYENKQAVPGAWTIQASASGYEPETRNVEVPTDDVTAVKFDLKLLGSLKIAGTPAGAAVSVNGPGGFSDSGGLPAEWSGLRSGRYSVTVSRDGYLAGSFTADVKPGETTALDVKLVRKGATPATTELASLESWKFRLTAEEAYDTQSHLEWQRAMLNEGYNWSEAQSHCAHLNLRGRTGWRVPSREELMSIVDRSQGSPTIDRVVFPGTPADVFWTGDAYAGANNHGWVVNFVIGSSYHDATGGAHYVRCVR